MRTDGSVIIDTKILDDGMEQGFERIKSDVGSVADEAKKAAQDIKAAFSEMDVSRPVADAMKKVADLERQLESVTAEHKFAISEDDDRGAERLASKMESIYSRLEAARERLSRTVEREAQKQAKAEERAAERSRKATEKEAKAKEKAMNKAYKAATKGARRFGSRLTEILSGALIFNAIGSGLRKLTSYFGDALKTNEQYRQSVARLKGALLTAFQPIYEYVVPAIVKLIDFLTIGAQAVARFFASLSGKSVQQMSQNAEAMYNQAKGIEQVGQEAKKAKRELMGFDELNRISDPNAVSSGSSATKSDKGTIAPVFGQISGDEITLELENVLDLVKQIGLALLAWKISSLFTNNLSVAAGLGLAVAGAFGYAVEWMDAFENGINWDNLGGMLLNMTALVGGLALAFGPVGAAIGLLITSIGLVVLALKEWIETGELSDEACAALVIGITGIGGAIALLTGSWIPLLVAAVAGLFIGIVKKGDKIKSFLDKLSDWLWNTFGRDWTELFGDFLGGIMNDFVESVAFYWGSVRDIFKGIIDFIQGVFTGEWKQALSGIVQIGKTILNYLIRLINQMLSFVVSRINALFRMLSFSINLPNGGSIGLKLPQFTTPQIPYLATGAVIPPNAPFMAVLGDQRHGTNIEAPEDLIRKIVREESGGSTEELAILRAILAATQASKNTRIYIGDNEVFQAVVDANDRATRIYGSSPLKV